MSPQDIGNSGVVEALKATTIFAGLDEFWLRDIAANCGTVRVHKGTAICRQGQKAERFFVVLHGRVRVYKTGVEGAEQTLHVYGPGHSFAEAAMLLGGDYPASAVAVAQCRLLTVPRATLLRAIGRNAEMALRMMAGMSGKLREFAQLIEMLSLKEAPARLAMALLAAGERAGSDTFELGQSKKELASQIGAAPETLSRALAKLRRSGLIAVNRSKITIRDRRRLANLASG